MRNYRDTGKLSKELTLWLDMSEELTPDDYRDALASTRTDASATFAALAPLADGLITLSLAQGPAPVCWARP